MSTVDRTISTERNTETKITRFDSHQIVQHGGLLVSFILLVVTGLPMKFHDSEISQWWVEIWGGIEFVRSAHHFAAWVIVIVCIYHLFYIIFTTAILKKPFPIQILPNRRDFITMFEEIMYFLGQRKEGPKFDRFNWKEKFDYWAIFWGMPVMAISGFVLMYPVLAAKYLPGWVIPASYVAHSDEAMLALTWIFMVHIFFSHFPPGVFPLNKSIFTGKVSRERYRKDHPLEYERLLGEKEEEKKS